MVLFDGQTGEPETLSEVIGQAVGAASVCWESMEGTGIFDYKRASAIVDEVLQWINENYSPHGELCDRLPLNTLAEAPRLDKLPVHNPERRSRRQCGLVRTHEHTEHYWDAPRSNGTITAYDRKFCDGAFNPIEPR